VSSWLVESSGNPAIDAEALAIVERAQPFAALPADVQDDTAVLTVPFNFGRTPAPAFTENDIPETWKQQVYARLSGAVRSAKRQSARIEPKRRSAGAPDPAQTVKVGVSLDRTGKLVSSWLVERSGFPELDEEALAIVNRAQPFPPPPVEVAGQDDFRLILPINFNSVLPWDDPVLKAKLNSVCRGC
jgi:protein TonB